MGDQALHRKSTLIIPSPWVFSPFPWYFQIFYPIFFIQGSRSYPSKIWGEKLHCFFQIINSEARVSTSIQLILSYPALYSTPWGITLKLCSHTCFSSSYQHLLFRDDLYFPAQVVLRLNPKYWLRQWKKVGRLLWKALSSEAPASDVITFVSVAREREHLLLVWMVQENLEADDFKACLPKWPSLSLNVPFSY